MKNNFATTDDEPWKLKKRLGNKLVQKQFVCYIFYQVVFHVHLDLALSCLIITPMYAFTL